MLRSKENILLKTKKNFRYKKRFLFQNPHLTEKQKVEKDFYPVNTW